MTTTSDERSKRARIFAVVLAACMAITAGLVASCEDTGPSPIGVHPEDSGVDTGGDDGGGDATDEGGDADAGGTDASDASDANDAAG